MSLQSHIEEISSVKKKVKVVVPAQKVRDEMEKAFQNLQQKVALPGFRKGKAPLTAVKTRYRSEVENEVSGELIQSSLFEILNEKKIQPVAYPVLENRLFLGDGALEFAVTLEVKPDIKVNGYKKLKLEKQVDPVDEKAVGEVLTRIQDHHSVLKDSSATVAGAEDYVSIGLTVEVDGNELPGSQMKGHLVQLGKAALIPELDAALPGMKSGESKVVAVPFPADHGNKQLAGKTAQMTVTLEAIKTKEAPALDDALAASVGEFKTLKELKEKISNDLTQERETLDKRRLEKTAIDQILAANIFEVPAAMVRSRFEHLAQQMIRSGMRPNSKDESRKLEETCYNMAVADIRADLALEAIAKQENLTVDSAELDKYTQEVFEQEVAHMQSHAHHHHAPGEACDHDHDVSPEKIAELKELVHSPENRENFRLRLLTRKTLDFIMREATITEVAKTEKAKK